MREESRKTYNSKEIINFLNFLKQEKEVLEKVSHPFIVKFYQCLKDNNLIYFLNEYVRGLELFDFIRDMGKSINFYFKCDSRSSDQEI